MRIKRCMAFAFAFIFAFIALALPRRAFAYEYNAYTIFQTEWYEDGDIDPTQGWIIYANNKYDAALYVCGDNVSSLTDEQLCYLSDPNYGGAFYALAQKFGTGFEHEWIPDYVRPMLALVDFDKVQVGWATTNEIAQAKARLQEIMNGDYGDGGGGGSDITSSYVINNSHLVVAKSSLSGFNSNNINNFVININIGTQLMNQINGLKDNYPCIGFVVRTNTNNLSYPSGNRVTIDYVLSTQPLNVTQSGSDKVISASSAYYAQVQARFNASGVIDASINTTMRSGSFRQTALTTAGTLWVYNAVSAPAEPDGDWPSAPVAPTPPELPTPTSPTVPVEPEPTIPEPTIPSDPIYIPVEAPDSTDYTDWLRAILEALNAIDDDLVTFASNVGDYFSAQNTFLRQIISEMATHCDHLQVRMHEEFAALTDYLNDLFTWLAGQMEFNFEGYDDSSIINWLRKIYGRLGGGTYKPNPDADPDTFLDWLIDQWNRFFTSLLEKLPDAIGDLVNDFQQLTRFFPFSIPWDLAALLGLFAHAPVTPVFDIPLPYGAGAGQSASIHVDCTPWDGVAAMVRPCFLAMFCLQLALLTRDLLKGLNVTGGDE